MKKTLRSILVFVLVLGTVSCSEKSSSTQSAEANAVGVSGSRFFASCQLRNVECIDFTAYPVAAGVEDAIKASCTALGGTFTASVACNIPTGTKGCKTEGTGDGVSKKIDWYILNTSNILSCVSPLGEVVTK